MRFIVTHPTIPSHFIRDFAVNAGVQHNILSLYFYTDSPRFPYFELTKPLGLNASITIEIMDEHGSAYDTRVFTDIELSFAKIQSNPAATHDNPDSYVMYKYAR